jgi:hypothetical protein
MSCNYIFAIRFTVEDQNLILKVAAFPNNVSPQPKGSFGKHYDDYSQVFKIPIKDEEAIAQAIEQRSREMDGGMDRRRREWITGDQAWKYWTGALSRSVKIHIRPPRLSAIYYSEIPRYFFGRPSPVPGFDKIRKGDLITPETARQLVDRDMSVKVREVRPGDCHQGSLGKLGFITQAGYLALFKPNSRTRGSRVLGNLYAEENVELTRKDFGPIIPAQPSPFVRNESGAVILADETTDLWTLVKNETQAVIQEPNATLVTAGFNSLRYYGFPMAMSLEDGQMALARAQKHIPELRWSLKPVTLFAKENSVSHPAHSVA